MANQESELERRRIEDVRKRFFQENGSNLNEFDEQDLRRLHQDDLWVRCFVRARKQDVQKAYDALVFCLKWRKSFGINEITETTLDRSLFEAGFLYPHNRDKEGSSMVLFIGRNYKKDPQQNQELKRFLVYLLEKHAKMYPGRKITMLFDMQETGLANMDMEFIKFIITCFTNYFPNTLAWLMVVELPWILSATWKIVRTWLSPEAVNKIKFVNKTELQDYIDEDKLLIKLGGTDPYEYTYPPTKEDIGLGNPQRDAEDLELPNNNEGPTEIQDTIEEADEPPFMLSLDDNESTSSRKKVKFDEGNLTCNCSPNPSTLEITGHMDNHPAKSNLKSLSSTKEQNKNPPKEPENVAKLLTITPPEEIVFSGSTSSTGEILQTLSLENNSSVTVAFKVKTTSPEGYRVRPSSGPISPGSFADISVFLQPGHAASVVRDKFLVMSTAVREGSPASEISSVWKKVKKSSIFEHRLRCRFVTSSLQQGGSLEYTDLDQADPGSAAEIIRTLPEQLKNVDKKLDQISRKVSYIEEGLQVFIKVQLAMFSGMVILFAVVFYYATYLT